MKKLYLLSILIGLTFANYCIGASYENFDALSIEPLSGQNGWYTISGYTSAEVGDTIGAETGTQYASTTLSLQGSVKEFDSLSSVITVYFLITNDWSGGKAQFAIGATSSWNYFDIYSNSINLTGSSDTLDVYDGVISLNEWHRLSFERTGGQIRGKYDFEPWTGWTNQQSASNSILLSILSHSTGAYFLYDSLATSDCNSTCYECDYYGCLGYDSVCYYNFPLHSCVPRENNVCGENWLCGFCTTEATCLAESCYWEGERCWQFSSTTTTTPFLTYYAEHSNYTTPTDFIIKLASTTDNWYRWMSRWSDGFGELFNASSSYRYGSTTGIMVPKLRGWLVYINEFFNIPLGYIIFVCILVLLASILWKIMQGIWHFIKVW